VVLMLVSTNAAPIKSRAGSLLTPAQHRAQAALLRANPAPKAQELAVHHDNLAGMIERRDAK
jgi:hypothetical protein